MAVYKLAESKYTDKLRSLEIGSLEHPSLVVTVRSRQNHYIMYIVRPRMARTSITRPIEPDLYSLQQKYSASHTFSIKHNVCIYFHFTFQVKVTWDPATKVMRTESNPAEGSAAKKSIVVRKIVDNGEMLMVSMVYLCIRSRCCWSNIVDILHLLFKSRNRNSKTFSYEDLSKVW